MNKLVKTLHEAVKLSGLKDGMTISFHHHLRNGDYVINLVMKTLADMGFHDLTINASSVFDVHAPLVEHIQKGVVTGLETDYMGAAVGRFISQGVMKKPVVFRTHGGRPGDILRGQSPIDVAFIAAPASDVQGNCTGVLGPSACGSLGYAFADAQCAKKVIVITDNLVEYPLVRYSIPETLIDYVVEVDAIGNAAGIVSGTTRITRDPVGLRIAQYATQVIAHSGLLEDGFSFQTGAGGISLAVARDLQQVMLEKKVKGSFAMGGTTGFLVDMLETGCFEKIMDVQCFDLRAVESLRNNPSHREVSAEHYASPFAKSCLVDNLDAAILGATEIDLNFNVNVHTDSNGRIMGGSGGHSDVAAGAKLAIVVAPLSRARLPIVVEKVLCTSTPGQTIDVFVTQKGIAVNPRQKELAQRLRDAQLPVKNMEELYQEALSTCGKPATITRGDQAVAHVLYRNGTLLDTIWNV